MKDQTITRRIGQRILKLIGNHQKKWEDTVGTIKGMIDLMMEVMSKRAQQNEHMF